MKCYKQVPVRGWAYMCFGIHELLGAHRTPAAREFLPLFVLVGTARHGTAWHGTAGLALLPSFPSLGGGCVLLQLRRLLTELGVCLLSLRSHLQSSGPLFPGHTPFPAPKQKEMPWRGRCTGTVGDTFTWFRLHYVHFITPASASFYLEWYC